MGGIIICEEEVPIPGHNPSNEQVWGSLEDYLGLKALLGDYVIDESRALHRHSIGIVPSAVSAWTVATESSDSVMIMARRIDWFRHEINGEPVTIMLVQIEQHY